MHPSSPAASTGGCGGSAAAAAALREVRFGYRLYSLSKVDAADESFHCDFRLFFRWTLDAAALPHPFAPDADAGLPSPGLANAWHPYVQLGNALTCEEVDRVPLGVVDPEHREVGFSVRFRGEFSVPLDLHDFPFDAHTLRIEARFSHRGDECDLEPDGKRTKPNHCVGGTRVAAGWRLRLPCHVVRYEHSVSTTVSSRTALNPNYGRKSVLCIHIPLQRDPATFLISTIPIMSAISLTSAIALCMPADALNDRTSVTMTVLLTLVAFKFAIAESLPKVPYLTAMDKYTILCLAFAFAVMLENVMCSVRGALGEWARSVDDEAALWAAIVWLIINTLLLLRLRSWFRYLDARLPRRVAQAEAEAASSIGRLRLWPSLSYRPSLSLRALGGQGEQPSELQSPVSECTRT